MNSKQASLPLVPRRRLRCEEPEPGYFHKLLVLMTTKYLKYPPRERHLLAVAELELERPQPSLPLGGQAGVVS